MTIDEGVDSFSLLPVLNGNPDWKRSAPVIHHSIAGMFAIREGKWKLIAGNGSGGRETPKGKNFEQPYQLYDLKTDPSEATDLINDYTDIATRLETKLEQIRSSGRSR